MLENAAELMIEKRNGEAIIWVKNKSGHMLPGDGFRTIILDVKISNPSGEIEYHQQIEHSMMLDSGQSDNRFQPDEISHHFCLAIGIEFCLGKGSIATKLELLVLLPVSLHNWGEL